MLSFFIRTFALMLVKTEAIVLRAIKYGENRLIVDLFTRQAGRLSCIITIPKTSKGRLKKQFFQPLSLLDVECDVRDRVQLQKMRDARLLFPYATLTADPTKIAISLFLAEFLYAAVRGEQQADEPLFDYMKNSLLWFDAATDGIANFHLSFLMHLSRFLGFYPNLVEGDEDDTFFDLREGAFCSEPPIHQDFLRADEAARIRTLMRMDYQNMHLFRMNRMERNRCLEVMLNYYRLHLPSFPELKSLAVFQELYA